MPYSWACLISGCAVAVLHCIVNKLMNEWLWAFKVFFQQHSRSEAGEKVSSLKSLDLNVNETFSVDSKINFLLSSKNLTKRRFTGFWYNALMDLAHVMKTLDTIILVSPLNRKKVVSYMKFLFYLFAAGLTNSKWQMNAFCFGI